MGRTVTVTCWSPVEPFPLSGDTDTHVDLFTTSQSLVALRVIVWLAALAGIIVYFLTNFMVGDFVAWLVGAGFGAAHAIAMCMYFLTGMKSV